MKIFLSILSVYWLLVVFNFSWNYSLYPCNTKWFHLLRAIKSVSILFLVLAIGFSPLVALLWFY
jgi:hypothetical protein